MSILLMLCPVDKVAPIDPLSMDNIVVEVDVNTPTQAIDKYNNTPFAKAWKIIATAYPGGMLHDILDGEGRSHRAVQDYTFAFIDAWEEDRCLDFEDLETLLEA